jgi:hypothetical protein
LAGVAANDPATITSTGPLKDGLAASSYSGKAWTITTAGRILGAGITLVRAGTAANTGRIAGQTTALGAGVLVGGRQ